MIDPRNVTKFDRTDAELEEWWLFSCIVAGKTADVQAAKLDRMLYAMTGGSPFDKLRCAIHEDKLRRYMEMFGIGQYGRLEACFTQSVWGLDLRADPVEKFETIHGVGPKTARMFLMHSRPNQRLAALDTHILAHLAEHGVEVPKATPGNAKVYRRLEEAFLALADRAGMSPADYDLMIWTERAREIKEAA
ncbi:putative N-glycosylase/DNA lyase [Caulobacter phage phiCbK]|uniref:Uncharacterized protein n=5 Tax=Viruses TaxID=10239 RepID=J3SVT7_9CAUD|nr:hypothetical protein D865_gp284 [Caulobacter phage phiCbK]AFO71701.1 putative N-glycosylase/DNA lyase [Caulobacter phage phiCbK]AFU86966.1 hypothetical protein CbK_gp134 [Caulobacter phage phiCbK]ARB15048.1 hypothetical protein Ccr32_gp130 [Caulobacter phage Ccr32]ARB15381.1 hypothetical protein Ccr34_gp139 [Caulobacter phage Ccr34]